MADVILRALIVACALLAGALGWALLSRERAVGALEDTRGALGACAGRLTHLIEDMDRDREIDALPDDALRDVPDRWLRPGADDTAR